jgi:hypothetical protein
MQSQVKIYTTLAHYMIHTQCTHCDTHRLCQTCSLDARDVDAVSTSHLDTVWLLAGAAVQAGILQGEVKNLMVMDQWQVSMCQLLA